MSSAVALNTRSRIRKREAVQEGSDDEGSDHRPRKVLVATMNDGHDSDSSEDVSLRRSQRTGLKMKFTRAGPGKGWAAVSQSEPNPQPSRDSRSQVEAGLRRSKRRTVLTSTPQTFSASLPAASTLQPEALATLAKVASREGQVQSPTDAALRWLDMPPSAVPKAPHRAQMTRQERARAREEIQRTKTVAKLSAQPTTSRKGLAGRGKSVSKKVNNSKTLPSQLEIQDEEWIGISTGINKPQLGTSHSPSPAIPRASPLLQESARDPLDEHQLLNHVTPPPVRPILRQHKELGFHPHEKAHVHEAIRRKKVFERRKKVIEKPPQQSKLSRVQLAGRGHANRKRTSQLTKATASLKVDFESDEWAGIGETTLAASTTVVSLEEMEELNVEHMLLPSPTSQPRSPQLSDEQSLSTAELPRTKNGGEASNSNPINRFHSRASSDPAQSHSQDLSDVAKITDHISGGSPGFNNTLQVNLGRVQTSLTQASLHLDSQPSQSHAAIETGLDSGALPTSSKHPYSTNDYAEISTVHDHGSPSDISTYPPPRDNISAIEEARTLDHIKKIKTSNKLVSQPRFSSTRGSRPRQQQFARDNNNKEVSYNVVCCPILVMLTLPADHHPVDQIAHPTALSPIPVAETDLGDLDPPQREDLETLMREIESDENMTDAEDSAGDQAPIASKDDVWGTEVQLPLSSVEHTHKPGTSKQSSRKAVQAHDTQTEDLIKRCNAVLDRAEKVLPTFPTAAEGQYATANDFARKTQAHSTRSGAKMAPRPRRPAVNAARARMRKYINDKMSRSNLRAPPPFVPADQLMPNAGARFALKQEPITSKFNKLSVQLLVQSYISTRASDLPHDGDYREEVESYFFYYIGHIYSRAAKMEDERRCDEIKRAARHSQRKQKKIVRRMKAASETPAYRRHVPMVSQMGVQAMSSEDTLSEGEGFLIRGVPWLSEEATNMLHGLDDAETYLLRHSAKQRLKRLPRITGPPLEDRKLRLGLPPNAYDSAYLESRGQDSKPSDEMYDFSLDQSTADLPQQSPMVSCVATLQVSPRYPVTVLSFSPESTASVFTLVASDEGGRTSFLAVRTGETLAILQSDVLFMTSITWNTANIFISGWNNGMIVEMEYQLVDDSEPFFKIVSYIPEKFSAQVSHLTFFQLNANVQILAAAAGSIVNVWIKNISRSHQWHKIHFSDLASRAPPNHRPAAYVINCLSFTESGDNLRLNAFLLGGYLCVWELSPLAEVIMTSGIRLSSRVGFATFSQDCKRFAVLNLQDGIDVYIAPTVFPSKEFSSVTLKPQATLELDPENHTALPLAFITHPDRIVVGGTAGSASVILESDGVKTPLIHAGSLDSTIIIAVPLCIQLELHSQTVRLFYRLAPVQHMQPQPAEVLMGLA
ncbi:hypothetical protein FRC05_009602 [Tulasnella sp. 425]|nr:hypothetical protein FRC05_009602 [Tulasnella sp. 425]